MRKARLVVSISLVLMATPGFAQPGKFQLKTDKYHVTDAERAACQTDAMTLCSESFPDEDLLVACMKTNRVQLTPVCRTTFEAGLRRRHIPF